MNSIKRLLCAIIFCMPLNIHAQKEKNGVKWITDLSWDQIKQKAKTENKYIFIDAYATWCGPCKMMDMKVYVNDTVYNLVNDNFISVRVQMDKTKKDNEYVKSWYSDAESIEKLYRVEGYPTVIFLTPEAKIVQMELGYKDVSDFVTIAKGALTPGKIYNDPYVEYDRLVNLYKKGIKNYDSIPFMVRYTLRLSELDFAVQLIKDHLNNYAKRLPKDKRYTKENIQMWNSVGLGTKSSIFKFFYEDGKMIDKVMGKKGYSEEVVDNTIRSQFVEPFFQKQNKDSSIVMTGMYLMDNGQLKASYADADWRILKDSIKNELNDYYAKKNVLHAKKEWYKRHRNYNESCKYALEYRRKYHSIKNDSYEYINSDAFEAFKFCTDKKVIDGFTKLLQKAMKVHNVTAPVFDTYANLLYKAGRKKEAIAWETKAVNESVGQYASLKDLHSKLLEKMEKGEHTWGKEVVWDYK